MLNLEIKYLFMFSARSIKINQNLFISNKYILLKPYTMPKSLIVLLTIIFFSMLTKNMVQQFAIQASENPLHCNC